MLQLWGFSPPPNNHLSSFLQSAWMIFPESHSIHDLWFMFYSFQPRGASPNNRQSCFLFFIANHLSSFRFLSCHLSCLSCDTWCLILVLQHRSASPKHTGTDHMKLRREKILYEMSSKNCVSSLLLDLLLPRFRTAHTNGRRVDPGPSLIEILLAHHNNKQNN